MRLVSTTKDLALAGGFGALLFAIDAVFTPLQSITNIPGIVGVVDTFFWVIVATIAILITRKLGFFTITAAIYGLMSVPMITWGGPGFHKLLMIMPVAAVVEAILLLTNYSALGINIAIATGLPVAYIMQLYVMAQLGISGAETYMKFLVPFLIAAMVEGFIGGAIGIWLYNKKIKNLKVVKAIQA